MSERLDLVTCGGRQDGQPGSYEVEFDPGEWIRGGFRERSGVLVHHGGQRVVLRTALTEQARRELNGELRMSRKLANRRGSRGYPAELSRVIGHRAEPDEPRQLLVAERGRPLSEQEHQLPLAPQNLWLVVGALLDALTALSELRVVHRAITLDSVLWDGSRVQLRDLGRMVHEGAARGGAQEADLWRSPEQVRGEGEADVRDDVYSAGVLIFRLATGEPLGPAAVLDQRAVRQDAAVRDLLSGVFVEETRRRPTVAALRRRLPGGRTTPPGGREHAAPGEAAGPVEREQQARTDFRGLRRQQIEYRSATGPGTAVPPPPPEPQPAYGSAEFGYPPYGGNGAYGGYGGTPRTPVRRRGGLLALGPRVLGGVAAAVLAAAAAVVVLVVR